MRSRLSAARRTGSAQRADAARLPDPSRRRVLSVAMLLALAAPASAALAQTGGKAPGQSPLRIGIIGAGRIGGAVGALWVRAGHAVMFSSRHPDQLKPLVDRLGAQAQAGTVAQAIAFGDVLFLAVPYGALPELGREHGRAMAGKVMLDATNAYRGRDGALADEVAASGIAATTARYLPGVRIVRAFNSMSASNFSNPEHPEQGPIAIPLAADDEQALRIAERLVRDAGFEPVVVGNLSTAGRFAPGGPLFQFVGTAAQLRRKMASP